MELGKRVWCFALLFMSSTCFAQMYTLIDLGTLGGTDSEASGINASGQVVGESLTSDLAWRAFRTAPNAPINPDTDNLGTLDGGSSSFGFGINASGQVVGEAFINNNTEVHAFRTAANSPINSATDDLGTLGGVVSVALGINDLGQVVGSFIWEE